jgi:ABC-type siderophore export system fused ATPase/permease subunit
MARTINLELTTGQQTEIAVDINSWEKLWHAIGYLTAWAADQYPTATIWRDGQGPDLVAHYRHEDGSFGYTIGAVWHGDHYGFHS